VNGLGFSFQFSIQARTSFFRALHALVDPAADHLIGQEPEPALYLLIHDEPVGVK